MSSYALVHEVYGSSGLNETTTTTRTAPPVPAPPRRTPHRERVEKQLRDIYASSGIFGIASMMSDDMLNDMKALICVSKRISPFSKITHEHVLLVLVALAIFLMIAKM
jgi:hypothetical protein